MNSADNESNAVKSFSSRDEIDSYRELEGILKSSPIFPGEILNNLGLFLTRASLARMLFLHDLYLKIVDVPGCVIELGCHWGQNLALFSTFRTIYEPQNIGRRIVGFDSFEGYVRSSEEDGQLMTEGVSANAATVSENYEVLLDRILDCHNALGPRAHIKKHTIIKGDVTETLPAYLTKHPDTIIALIYFDLGLHEPTRKCLDAIKNHLARGSVIGFDHLGMQELPGDSLAVMDVLGYRNCRFYRDPRVPYQSYLVVE